MDINPQLKNAMGMRRSSRTLAKILGPASHKRSYFCIGWWTCTARRTIARLKSTR